MRCAVLGDPIAHSLSPTLHRAGYAELGLDWRYDAVRVPSGTLADFLAEAAQDPTWRGLSLTMPLKREVLDQPGVRPSDRVQLTGGANTVVFADDALLLDNTDLPGAAAALRERWDGDVTSVVVLGGGATAASVGLALVDLGARDISLLVRTPARAAETREAIAAHPSAPQVNVGLLGEPVGDVDVLVSTVPATAQTADLVTATETASVVFEVLYDPWPTPIADATTARGGVLVGGLDLLVHQAALQFEQFTGHEAPLEAMRAAGQRELAERERR